MKGLLLKDYYLVRSVLFIILIVFAVIGVALSFLTSSWVLTVLATIMFGMISVTTINMDKTSGWRKVAGVLPVSKKTVMDSKYVLYLLLSGAGFVFGVALGAIASLMKNQFDLNTMLLYISVSIALALLSGSITIPCSVLLGEEKNVIGLIISYPVSAVIFVVAVLLFENRLVACGVTVFLGVVFYIASWLVMRKQIAARDIA